MNARVRVSRMQYGIGQGCFHAQQIRVMPDVAAVEIEPYRFVYDCGSDTAAIKTGQESPLDWAIRHFSDNDDPNSPDKLRVDSLYLSHFQKDHIDGAKRLAELVDLKEIVIPHLSQKQFAHILGQQISSGALTALTPGVQEYLAVLGRAAGDGPIIEGIPTTRVQAGGEPPRPDAGGGQPAEPLRPGNPQVENRISHSVGTNTTWAHRSSRLLRIQSSKDIALKPSDIWELRVWSFAQDAALTDAVIQELTALKNSAGQPALALMIQGIIDLNEISWAFKNRVLIQSAYEKALKSQRVPLANDHNVVSLCLHSGPTESMIYDWTPSYYSELRLVRRLIGHRKASSWLGTGDALLGNPTIWADFHRHFTQDGSDRTQKWQTVLMPHHGSEAGGNFNPGLLAGPIRYAVFSAGAFNKYRHPSRGVLELVADSSATAVIVTEFNRPGFFEDLTYSLRPAAWGSW